MSLVLIVLFKFFFLKLIIAGEVLAMEPTEKIIVGFTKREPFVYTDQHGNRNGLDIMIMENFARKHNLKLEYIEHNISLNEISNNKKAFEEYIQQDDLQ